MSHLRDATARIAAAHEAAAEGDFATAARFLREVVRLQEAELGLVHPDLANTLNNLGVACERAGNLDEAEVSYRRAHAIAKASLDPDHVFVIQSAENLRQFCEARGRPFDPPAPQATPPSRAESTPLAAGHPTVPARAPRRQPGPSARRGVAPIVVALGAAALVTAWLLAGRGSLEPEPRAQPVNETPAARQGEAPAPETVPGPAPEATPSRSPLPPPPSSAPAETPAPEPAPSQTRPAAAEVEVVRADVCRTFSTGGPEWNCDPVSGVTSPGALVFYTRVRSPRSTTVEHRWYRGVELVQRVPLGISANPGAGYRTFSRHTVTAAHAGDWRVELRSGDQVLHEERFVVR